MSDEPQPMSRESLVQASLVVGCCWLYACGLTLADPDLWGHTLYGLRALQQGVLVETTDPFSYTAPGAEWVNHEWLTELQFGWLWREWGNAGLWWWRNLVIAIPFAIAWCEARRRGASAAGIAATLVPTAICLSQFACFVRPQLATYAFLAATLAIVVRFANDPRRMVGLWSLPLITMLWTNMHGGFLAGLGVLFIAWLELLRRVVTRQFDVRPFAWFTGIAVLCGLSTLVTPYGIGLHSMLWYHLGTEQIVSEWQPVWATRLAPAYFVPFLLPVVAFSFSRRWTWLDLFLFVVIGLQGLLHLKHVALVAVACLVLLPAPLSDAVGRVFSRVHAQWSGPRRGWLRWAGTSALLAIIGLLQLQSALPMWAAGLKPWDIAVSTRGYVPGVPLQAVRVMQRAGLHGNVVTDYGWAQFVIWHLHPESRLAFDGRYRTVYPPELERDYVAFVTVDPESNGKQALLDDYDSDYVLISRRRDATIAYLDRRPDWGRFYADDQAVLFVRGHVPHERPVEGDLAAPKPWEIFPGAHATPTGGNLRVTRR